jgi:hypothetical protein
MTSTDRIESINTVQRLGPLLQTHMIQRDGVDCGIGLSPAPHTPARTGHDLHKVIAIRLFSYELQKTRRVTKAMGHSHTNRGVV